MTSQLAVFACVTRRRATFRQLVQRHSSAMIGLSSCVAGKHTNSHDLAHYNLNTCSRAARHASRTVLEQCPADNATAGPSASWTNARTMLEQCSGSFCLTSFWAPVAKFGQWLLQVLTKLVKFRTNLGQLRPTLFQSGPTLVSIWPTGAEFGDRLPELTPDMLAGHLFEHLSSIFSASWHARQRVIWRAFFQHLVATPVARRPSILSTA